MEKIKKYYDLSQPVYAGCPGWPTYETVTIRKEASHQNDQFEAEQIRMNSHTGTHIDAPYHFYKDGLTIDQIPVEQFQGRGVLVDLRGRIQAREGITEQRLAPYKDMVGVGDIVILNTGWGKLRSLDTVYIHDWPYLTGEAAQWLSRREIKGAGTDCVSMGGWYEGTGRPCHEELLGSGIWIIEELFLPDELMEDKTCSFTAYPLLLQGFSGAPARAVAVVERAVEEGGFDETIGK